MEMWVHVHEILYTAVEQQLWRNVLRWLDFYYSIKYLGGLNICKIVLLSYFCLNAYFKKFCLSNIFVIS